MLKEISQILEFYSRIFAVAQRDAAGSNSASAETGVPTESLCYAQHVRFFFITTRSGFESGYWDSVEARNLNL
jgi:hypothetical protein